MITDLKKKTDSDTIIGNLDIHFTSMDKSPRLKKKIRKQQP